jgi:hypothetical protein
MRLDHLEIELKKIEIPKSIKIKSDLNITDCQKFIDSHLTILKANSGNKRFIPYYNRLLLFYKTIKNI